MLSLRTYQSEAVAAVYEFLRNRVDNPCVVIPTGGGKTPCIAAICRDSVLEWHGRVLVLAHVRELLEQNRDHIGRIAPELARYVGVYSAGLKSRQTEHPVIVAGIQSVYRRACDLGKFDLVIVDEAHLIPPDGEGMYRTFLKDAHVINPDLRIIGFTATPYRMSTGMICGPENLLNAVCYEVGVKQLIVGGFLSPLIPKAGRDKVDASGIAIRAGEFVPGELERLMDTEPLVKAACTEIIEYTKDRRSCLIFASGVEHGQHIERVLNASGEPAASVFGDTDSRDRRSILDDFRAGRLKYLVNMGVLTTGFDAPNIDCVALVRPTMSPGLYYQMVGRGFRKAPEKTNCLVLDFGGNILRHGPVDEIRVSAAGGSSTPGEAPAKECPNCRAVLALGYGACPQCGFIFPKPELKHEPSASEAGILAGQIRTAEHEVVEVRYSVHQKYGDPDAPTTMRVRYYLKGLLQQQSEWICFNHTGWARSKAESWWRARSNAPIPKTVEDAVEMANQGALALPVSIQVRTITGEKYPDRIVGAELGTKPEWIEREAEGLTAKEFQKMYQEEYGEDAPF